jgi:hypothetical protein
MDRIPEPILSAGNRSFWDVDPPRLNPRQHEDFMGVEESEPCTTMPFRRSSDALFRP